ncbi:MAG TPA: ABC transporter permease [Pseudoneobacillus sp.]|nr:ABC transporter permease [Pseudoneobacillus sp.]
MNKFNIQLAIGLAMVVMIGILATFAPIIVPQKELSIEEKANHDGKFSLITNKMSLITEEVNGETIYHYPPAKPFQFKDYPLGTDRNGYDLLSMLAFGCKITLIAALGVALFRLTFGTIIGLYLGLLRNKPSWWISVENASSYIPLFLIVYLALLPVSFGEDRTPLVSIYQLTSFFIILVGILGLPSVISTIRKKTELIYEMPYILCSRSLGARKGRIALKHILPQLKENILILLTTEMLATITLMGQLGIFNIFIGGTIRYSSPVEYISFSNEWAGLVGQSRGSIYSEQHIIVIPLLFLLFAIIGFSLIVKGINIFYGYESKSAYLSFFKKRSHLFIKEKVESDKNKSNYSIDKELRGFNFINNNAKKQ